MTENPICHFASSGADVCLHLNGGCAQICASKLGFAHCSCLPRYILAVDGVSCLPHNALNETAGDLFFFSVQPKKDTPLYEP